LVHAKGWKRLFGKIFPFVWRLRNEGQWAMASLDVNVTMISKGGGGICQSLEHSFSGETGCYSYSTSIIYTPITFLTPIAC
jgi:hypothetical protein